LKKKKKKKIVFWSGRSYLLFDSEDAPSDGDLRKNRKGGIVFAAIYSSEKAHPFSDMKKRSSISAGEERSD